MAISPGMRLGAYEVVAKIGAGGMGEVYRARDTKLDRDVAIKVLPEAVASDAERLARFEREAKTLAALNHPGIAAIYGFEDSGEAKALVMELVEGPTLADRLASGAIPVAEAVRIAIQLAEALEAAHRQGIIHRDLKPANVKVRRDGTVKILDFGLAKAMEPAPTSGASAGQAHSLSPTITTPAMTQAGMILGTAAYMSPEQAQGLDVDERTDIWAFGCVLYEMLTGQTLFAGDNVSLTLARILERTPDFEALPAGLRPRLGELLERCLEKDARNRWHHMGDVRVELERAQAEPSGGSVPPGPAVPGRSGFLALAAVALVAAAAGGVAVWSLQPPSVSPQVSRFSIPLPAGRTLGALRYMSPVAVSPDGRTVAYVGRQGDIEQLYVRALGETEARLLPGTEEAEGPFFSPDGTSVAFFAGAGLKRVAIAGGVPRVIAPAVNSRGGSWGADGTILFASTAGASGIQRVVAEGGGDPETVAAPEVDGGEGLYRFPQFLPGGEHFLYTVGTGGTWDDALIVVQNLKTGARTRLIEGGSDARYVPGGYLVYNRGGGLRAVPFDLDRLEVTGDPVAVVPGVMQSREVTGASFVAVSGAGELVYVPGTFLASERRVVWLDQDGSVEPLPIEPQSYMRLDLAPRGDRVAVEVDDGNQQQIWIHDFARPGLSRLPAEGVNNQMPRFTPDGGSVSYVSYPLTGVANTIVAMRTDGSGSAEHIVEFELPTWRRSFSPDGMFLAIDHDSPDSDRDISILALDRTSELQPFLSSEFNEKAPRFSPDGHWLSYHSDESNRGEVYVRSFPEGDRREQVSRTGSGLGAAWRGDGRELYYLNGNRVMAAEIGPGPALEVGAPRELFETPFPVAPDFDVTPDGRRFLMIQVGNETDGRRLDVVLNFGEELRRQVPAD